MLYYLQYTGQYSKRLYVIVLGLTDVAFSVIFRSIFQTFICNMSWSDRFALLLWVYRYYWRPYVIILGLTSSMPNNVLIDSNFYFYNSRHTTALKQIYIFFKQKRKRSSYTLFTWTDVIRYINNFNKAILPGLVLMLLVLFHSIFPGDPIWYFLVWWVLDWL